MHVATTRSPEVAELAAMAETLTRMDWDREQAYKEEARSNRRLRVALDLTPVGTMIVQDRRILLANRRLAEITGYTQDELVGADTRILYPTETEWVRTPAALANGEVRTVRLRKKDGTVRECRMSCAIVDRSDREWVVNYLDPCCGT